MALENLSDAEIRRAVKKHGSQRKAALSLGIPWSTWSKVIATRRLSFSSTPNSRSRDSQAVKSNAKQLRSKITRESLHEALIPPNLCAVRIFLDALSGEERDIVEEALSYSSKDFSAASLCEWLKGLGFKDSEIPGLDAIHDHRSGRRRCRCRG